MNLGYQHALQPRGGGVGPLILSAQMLIYNLGIKMHWEPIEKEEE